MSKTRIEIDDETQECTVICGSEEALGGVPGFTPLRAQLISAILWLQSRELRSLSTSQLVERHMTARLAKT